MALVFTREDADKSDMALSSLSSSLNALVYVGESKVCAGRGVFATRLLPKGSYITAYAGSCRSSDAPSVRQKGAPRSLDYLYECTDGLTIDGAALECQRSAWMRHGVAQLVNDAIHPDLHAHEFTDNNCMFVEVDVKNTNASHALQASQVSQALQDGADCDSLSHPDHGRRRRVYLVALRHIYPREELLCSYGMSYWIHKHSQHVRGHALLPAGTADWLDCHARILCTIRDAFIGGDGFKCDMHEYRGTSEEGLAEYLMEISDGCTSPCMCERSVRRWQVHLIPVDQSRQQSDEARFQEQKTRLREQQEQEQEQHDNGNGNDGTDSLSLCLCDPYIMCDQKIREESCADQSTNSEQESDHGNDGDDMFEILGTDRDCFSEIERVRMREKMRERYLVDVTEWLQMGVSCPLCGVLFRKKDSSNLPTAV